MSRSSADDLFALLGRLPQNKGEDDTDLSPPVSPIRRTTASPARYTGTPPAASSLARGPSASLPTVTGHTAPPLSGRLRPTTSIDDLRPRSGQSASASLKRLSGTSDEPPLDVLSLFSSLTQDLARDESALAGADPPPPAEPLAPTFASGSGSGKNPRELIQEMIAAPLPQPPARKPPSPPLPEPELELPSSPPAFRGWASQPPMPVPTPLEAESEPAPNPFAVFQRELLKSAEEPTSGEGNGASSDDDAESNASERDPAESPSAAILKAMAALNAAVGEGSSEARATGGSAATAAHQHSASHSSPNQDQGQVKVRRSASRPTLDQQLELLRRTLRESGDARGELAADSAGVRLTEEQPPATAAVASGPSSPDAASQASPTTAGAGQPLKPRKAAGRAGDRPTTPLLASEQKQQQPKAAGDQDSGRDEPGAASGSGRSYGGGGSMQATSPQQSQQAIIEPIALQATLKPVRTKSGQHLQLPETQLPPRQQQPSNVSGAEAAAAGAVAPARQPVKAVGADLKAALAAARSFGSLADEAAPPPPAAATAAAASPASAAAAPAEGLVPDSPESPPLATSPAAAVLAVASAGTQPNPSNSPAPPTATLQKGATSASADAMQALLQRHSEKPVPQPHRGNGGVGTQNQGRPEGAQQGSLSGSQPPVSPTPSLGSQHQALGDAVQKSAAAAAAAASAANGATGSDRFSLRAEASGSSSGAFGSFLGAISSFLGIIPSKGLPALPPGAVGCVASGGDDGLVRLWDPASGACTAVLRGHKGAVTCLAPLFSGSVASGSMDKTIVVWDRKTFSPATVLRGHTHGVNALCVYDENRLISGSDDCTLRVWKVSPGDCLRVIRHESSVTTVLCLSDGQIFCASLDQKLRLWDDSLSCQCDVGSPLGGTVLCSVIVGTRRESLKERVSLTESACPYIVTGSANGSMGVWQSSQAYLECIRAWDAHDGKVEVVSHLSTVGGDQLASLGSDKLLRTWLMTGHCLRVIDLRGEKGTGMAACSFGRWLLLSRSNGQLGLWGGEGLFPPLLTVLEKASSGPGPDVAGPPRTGSMQSAPVQDQHFGGTEGITTRGGGIRCLVALLPEGMTPPGRGWCCPQGPASGWQNQQNAPLEASSGLVSSRRLG